MANLGEAALHGSPDALGRRVGRDELRVRRLEVDELPEQQVVLAVRHLGRIEHVVSVVRFGQDAPELLGPGGGIGRSHASRPAHRRTRIARRVFQRLGTPSGPSISRCVGP